MTVVGDTEGDVIPLRGQNILYTADNTGKNIVIQISCNNSDTLRGKPVLKCGSANVGTATALAFQKPALYQLFRGMSNGLPAGFELFRQGVFGGKLVARLKMAVVNGGYNPL